MISKKESFDFASFLPSFWTNNLPGFPILGSEFRIIDLDLNFIKYIESDGIILEDDVFSLGSSLGDSNFSDNDYEKSKVDIKPSDLFPEIHQKIQNAISFLGGCVVPKLNWTVPTDSTWISANTLKCTSVNEVYQILKASDKINSDLELLKSLKLDPQLFLRPFVEIHPEFEFRCFVIDGDLIAISQRNLDIFNPAMSSYSQIIIDKISACFEHKLGNIFASKYSFDVYFSEDLKNVFIVDINPLFESSSTGLFSYSELITNYKDLNSKIWFRCIKNNDDVIIGLCEKNFIPVDLLNYAGSDINNIDFNNFNFDL